jgi:PEGA domain-containing protein
MSSRITVDQTNRTIICSVVFVDLVEYSKRPVGEQMAIKDRFTALLAGALKDIALSDRIVLDTGDGAAMSFLGDPEDALFVAMTLRDAMKATAQGGGGFRVGVNLGPVRLVRDINGQPNIVGDGINVAQRIMSFAEPGQLLVSRSYYDAVSCLAEEYGKLFRYDGSRTDKHVRDHDVYVVGESESAFIRAKTGMERRAAQTDPNLRSAPWSDITGGAGAAGTGAQPPAAPGFKRKLVRFLRDRTKVNITGGALGTLVVVLAVLVAMKPMARPVAASPAASEPAAAEGAKAAAVTATPEGEKAAAHKQLPPGTVNLAVAPWGEVFVDGKSRGLTPPMKNLKLPPGEYKIEIRNTKFPPRVETVQVRSRETVTVRHEFKK